ncbi:hypothetical protein JW877_05625 [bacterium]|nr:hypothetical protein [bacterium]
MIKIKVIVSTVFFIIVSTGVLFAQLGPAAMMKFPTPNAWAGCPYQEIYISLTDADGVNESTIELTVGSTLYSWPNPQLAYLGDTMLVFTPTSPFSNFDTVDVILHEADDELGNPLQGRPKIWKFYVDLDDPFIDPASRVPPPGTVITSGYSDILISIQVRDTTSGLRLGGGTMCMCFDSRGGTNCYGGRASGCCWDVTGESCLKYNDTTFEAWTEQAFLAEDSVRVCFLKAIDRVQDHMLTCGPHWVDTLDSDLCWDFIVDAMGPRAELVWPNPGDTIACDSLVIRLTDMSGVDMEYFQVRASGSYYWHYSPYVSIIGDSLVIVSNPIPVWPSEGPISARMQRARDIYGNYSYFTSGHFPDWTIYMDKIPPEASAPQPPPDTIISETQPIITLEITDNLSGVDPASLQIRVAGVVYNYSHAAVSWSDPILTFSSVIAGVSFNDGDTVEVCLTGAADRVAADRCGPNELATYYCWSFSIDQSGPVASLIIPPTNHYTACLLQPILIEILDPGGIDPNTISMTVEGTVYNYPDHLNFSNDTLTFTPTTPWTDGATINFTLNNVQDWHGNGLAGPLTSQFYVDLTAPVPTAFTPAHLTVTADAYPVLEIGLTDAGAGVDPATAVINIRGSDFSYAAYPGAYSWDGNTLSFNTIATGLTFAHNETLQVCIHVGDNITPQYCGPNFLDSCWSFIFDLQGPNAEMVVPPPGTISGCDDQTIGILIEDESDINFSTISLWIDGTIYDFSDVTVAGDTVFFASGSWSDGDNIVVRLLDVDDVNGNPLEGAPLEWSFLVDLEPPFLGSAVPPSGSHISNQTPIISMNIFDTGAGLNTGSVQFTINGVTYNSTSPGVSWSGSRISIDCGLAGITFNDGDTVEVCLTNAADLVSGSYCGPNILTDDSCWFFYIDLSAPVAELVCPINGAIVACSDQIIRILITDPNGIVHESTSVDINGTLYQYSSPQVSFHGDTLIFDPTFLWTDGDTVIISMASACDSNINCIEMGSYEWAFIVDLTPPYLDYADPEPFAVISDSMPNIHLELPDDVSGINPTTLRISVNGIEYSGLLPGVTWPHLTDYGFLINTSALLGFSWDDTMEICILEISDLASPFYCGPNIYAPDTCWEYYLDMIGPTAILVSPDNAVISACSLQSIVIELTDNVAVVPENIVLNINGAELRVFDPRLEYENDTLVYTPIVPWDDGDTINFEITAADDYAGNTLEGPAAWSFIIDLSPPEVLDYDPPAWAMLSDSTPVITIQLEDLIAGVDPSSIVLNIGGIPHSYPASGMTWNAGTGTLTYNTETAGITFENNDTVRICLTVSDLTSPLFCGPNTLGMFCWRVSFDTRGPTAHIISPQPGQYTACDDQRIYIYLHDTRGVEASSVNLVINSVSYDLDAEELSYLNDTLLLFIPSIPWTDGAVINVSLSGVADEAGNVMETPLSWSFNVDLSPPTISNIQPPPGSTESSDSPLISFDLQDAGSGLDETSFIVSIESEVLLGLPEGVNWDGLTYSVDPETLGLRFNDGDTVRVCLLGAMDTPDLCPANEIADTCWEFYISSTGPRAFIITPPPNAVSACADQQIQIRLYDGNGIDESSIRLRIGTTIYTTSDSRLTYMDSILTFNPSPLWTHGAVVNVTLLQAKDMMGTPLESGALAWTFRIDLEPPVITDIEPPHNAFLSNPDTTIIIIAQDDVAGINHSSLIIEIGSIEYYSADVTWLGDTITFSLTSLGFLPEDGEELEICLIQLADAPDLCEPNFASDTCWTYLFDFRGPQVNFTYPEEELYTSCEDFDVQIWIYDRSGVDTSSIVLEVNGVVYSWPDPALSFISNTLRFSPPYDWVDGDSVLVRLLVANDLAGNGIGPGIPEWWFGLDFSPPMLSNEIPPEGSIVSESTPEISIDIEETASGLDLTTLQLTVNGIAYVIGDPGISWDGLTLTFSPESAGIVFNNEEPVNVCLAPLSDLAVLCGANTSALFCWEFDVDYQGPQDSLVLPIPGTVTTCADQEIRIRVYDINGIDCSSLTLRVDAIEYTTAYAGLTCSDTLIIFTPPDDFDEGYIDVRITYIEDLLGNATTDLPLRIFAVDLTPPEVIYFEPPAGSVSGDATGNIALILYDEFAGLDTSSIVVTINGISFYYGSLALEWGDSMLYVHPERVGITFNNNDTVTICVRAADDPDYCPPNIMDPRFCWDFLMDLGGPEAEIVSPGMGLITSCYNQEIEILINDISGVDPGSIQLDINGTIYTVSDPELAFLEPNLNFTPTVPWTSGDSIYVVLRNAQDVLGNPLSAADSVWSFFVVDIAPPVAFNFYPPNASTSSDTEQVIWLTVVDSLSGVDPNSLVLEVDGIEYRYGESPFLTWTSGRRLTFDPSAAGVFFGNGDTVRICLTDALDTPDLCPPNRILDPYCWYFVVDISGPRARIIQPHPDAFVACGPGEQNVIIEITDDDGIVPDSILLVVQGVNYRLGSNLAFSYPSLTFTPPVAWTDGEIVHVILENARDSLYNPLGIELDWDFTVDLSPPAYSNPQPPNDAVVSDPEPQISINLTDIYSGVLPSSIIITVNGDPYLLGSGLAWTGTMAVIHPESLRASFEDGEMITVCLEEATDAPDYCDPNAITAPFCWEFEMDIGGPVTRIISPQPGTYIACTDSEQQILIYLWDDTGIIADSILMTINENIYSNRAEQVRYIEDSLLSFQPLYVPWDDGDTVIVELTRAVDGLGNRLSSPLSWEFYVDLSAPRMLELYPAAGEIIGEANPLITMNLWDELSGLDTSSIILSVNGTEYAYGVSPALTYEGITLSFNTAAEGLSFGNNDTVDICLVQAGDLPDYCEANQLRNLCWEFYVDLAGPAVLRHSPSNGAFTSCPDQNIVIILTDLNGIDETTVDLIVSGVSYGISDPELSFAPDSNALIFNPSTLFTDGDVVTVNLAEAGDTVGNISLDLLSFSFTVDLNPPYASNPIPLPGSSISDPTPTISIEVSDDLSGVDPASLMIMVAGTYTFDTSGGLDWDGVFLTLETESAGLTFEDGELIEVCLMTAADRAGYCGANEMEIPFCWTFTTSLAGPVATIIQPLNRDFVACRGTDQMILMSITDDDGVVEDSIILTVNGVPYTPGDLELTWTAPQLRFIPSVPWTDGAFVNVVLTRAVDGEGNGMGAPISWSFRMDLSPPRLINAIPTAGSSVSPTLTEIRVELEDSLSGLGDSLRLRIDGIWYDPSSPAIGWDGFALIFYPDIAGLVFMAGDTIEVCVIAFDQPDWCDPNQLDSCWYFTIAAGGPLAEAIQPHNGEITSCEDMEIIIQLLDPEGDAINETTIVLLVEGDTIRFDDPGFYFSPLDVTIHYVRPTPYTHGDSVAVILLDASDIFGATLETPLAFWFFVDLMPPVASGSRPVPGATIGTARPDLRLLINDALAGVELDSLAFKYELRSYTYSAGELVVSGDTVRLYGSSLDEPFPPGDTICITASFCDQAMYCPANCDSFTWCFSVGGEGPIPTLITPPDSIITSCSMQTIIIVLNDVEGVDPDSIRLIVDGDIFTIDSPELSLEDDTLLIFNPDVSFSDGEIVMVELYAADIIGNPLDPSPFVFSFTIDLSPPIYSNPFPAELSYVDNFETPLLVELEDLGAGVDPGTISFHLDMVQGSRDITGSEPGFSFDGLTLMLDPVVLNDSASWTPDLDTSGIWFHERDTVLVTVTASDRAQLCGENTGEYAWRFIVEDDDTIPPNFAGFTPDTIAEGVEFYIECFIGDSSGVFDDSTGPDGYGVYLVWDDDGSLTDGGEDTLLMSEVDPASRSTHHYSTDLPVPAQTSGAGFIYRVYACDNDYDFMTAEDRSCRYSETQTIMIRNAEGPEAQLLYPEEGAYSSCQYQRIIILLEDRDGIDAASVLLTVDSDTVAIGPDLTLIGDTLVYDPPLAFSNGQTVTVILVSARDNWGNDLETYYEWSFNIDLQGPLAELIEPPEGSTIDDVLEITLTLRDSLAGINSDSIILSVDGLEYRVDEPGLSWSPGNGVLFYSSASAGQTFTPGETLWVELAQAYDNALYCGPNGLENSYRYPFVTLKELNCEAYPVPFTPNRDTYNDTVWFNYPDQHLDAATLYIYDFDGREMVVKNLEPSPYHGHNFWDGQNSDGKAALPGVYLYVIKVGDDTVCKGTVVLTR